LSEGASCAEDISREIWRSAEYAEKGREETEIDREEGGGRDEDRERKTK
jgi:hypothetical protein